MSPPARDKQEEISAHGHRPDLIWIAQAACRNEDPEAFFPIGTQGSGLAEIAQAKAICDTCAVRGHCLDYALSMPRANGIWGGMTEEERHSLLRQRQRQRQRQRHNAADTSHTPPRRADDGRHSWRRGEVAPEKPQPYASRCP